MRRVAWTTAVLLLLCGCTPNRGVVYRAAPGRPVANLALGPTADHTWLAEQYTYRSSWPSVETGYRFDDATDYTQFIRDDQSYYDDFQGGGYSRQSLSVRTGVIVR